MYENNQTFRRLAGIVSAAIFGGGFLAMLIGLIYVLGSLAEQLQLQP